MLRWCVVFGLVGGLLFGQSGFAPAQAEFRFSSQRSLSAPDPFLKRKKKPRSIVQVALMGPGLAKPAKKSRMGLTYAALGPVMTGASPLASETDAPLVWGKFDPRLVQLIGKIESHFGHKVFVSSGCRTPEHNRRVGGALHSYHMKCMAADISIAGVSTARLRDFAMAMPERGGVGTYCSTPIVHVDVGPKRQWYWGCGYRSSQFDRFALR